FILFLILWSIRKRIKKAGVLVSIYLIFNGVERFLIEKIRVNTKYNLFGFHPTQAELIATLLIIGGVILLFFFSRQKDAQPLVVK
ncbi:MAG TPA: prolipoprotein diacylglyceryl transferase family protein, partial [Segetibacter sp.]